MLWSGLTGVMAELSLMLLGGFQARLGPGPVLALPTRKAQALLAYLALPLGQAHPRDKLAALLWGGIREESARASLRQALFVIRKALGEDAAAVLRQDGDLVALSPAAVDVDEFERAVATGSAESLTRAAELYRGDLLAGLGLDEAPFEEWLLGERERLRELALEGLAKLIAHQRRADAATAAVQTALKLLALDPLQEAVHRTLMRLYAELGRREAALRQYQQCVGVLQRELGIEPEAATKTLYQEILRQRALPAAAVAKRTARDAERAAEHHTAPAEIELVGRVEEMRRLRTELDGARSGAERVVAVIGEAGIGKTRLVGELAADAARLGMRVLLGRSYQSEQILPFGPWVDAMRDGRLTEDADLLARLVPALRPELARLLPEIGGGPAGGTTDVRPIFESVAQLIGHLVERQPLLVVLEDLHWADEMSARLFEFIGRRLAPRPVIVVVTAREEELADAPVLRQALDDLRREARLTTLTLGPLSRLDTLALVRALARSGDETALRRLGERVWTASEGHPLMAVETLQALREGAGESVATQRVREIVTRRLDRLSERAQHVAAVAAVIGREFEFSLLAHAARSDEEAVADGVEELVRRRILHGVRERFDFAHDRIREVAYSRILAPRRRLLHRRVAEAIEALYAADTGSHALALGLHYQQAEEWNRAAGHLYNAGEAARDRAANREAVGCLDAALQCLRSLPEGLERSERVIDTILQLENAHMGLGEFLQSLEGLHEAEALARSLGDRGRLGRVFSRFGYNLGSIGDLAGAIQSAERARELAIELGDARSHVSSNVVLARARYARGDYRLAMESVRENDAIARETRERPRSVSVNISFSRTWGVLALAELGEFAEAITRGDEALQRSAGENGPHGDVWARLGVGRLYLVKGDLARAIEVLEPGMPICEAEGDLGVYFSRAAATLGGAYALSGRLDEALSLLDRADRHAETIRFAYGHALVVATLAEAKLLAGDVSGAAVTAHRAFALSRQHGQRGWEAWARRGLADIAGREAAFDLAAVETRFRDAVALAHELEMRPLLAHCRCGLGTAYARADREELARTELEAALGEYRAMAMPYWVTRAESLLSHIA
jgi:DNA-binding SARP family transcriptional activator